jgi:hypothetical protein
MEFIFILLVGAFIALLYVLPSLIVIALFVWIVGKINSNKTEYLEDIDDVCYLCGDNEEWCKHVP